MSSNGKSQIFVWDPTADVVSGEPLSPEVEPQSDGGEAFDLWNDGGPDVDPWSGECAKPSERMDLFDKLFGHQEKGPSAISGGGGHYTDLEDEEWTNAKRGADLTGVGVVPTAGPLEQELPIDPKPETDLKAARVEAERTAQKSGVEHTRQVSKSKGYDFGI